MPATFDGSGRCRHRWPAEPDRGAPLAGRRRVPWPAAERPWPVSRPSRSSPARTGPRPLREGSTSAHSCSLSGCPCLLRRPRHPRLALLPRRLPLRNCEFAPSLVPPFYRVTFPGLNLRNACPEEDSINGTPTFHGTTPGYRRFVAKLIYRPIGLLVSVLGGIL